MTSSTKQGVQALNGVRRANRFSKGLGKYWRIFVLQRIFTNIF